MDRLAFDSISVDSIESFIATRQEENVRLEFKTAGNDISSGGDKRNLAEMLSGFANSAGGMIVWGVATEKDTTSGLDVAASPALIVNPARFRVRLEELVPQMVSPNIAGVSHREITRPDGSGYVVTFVPESEGDPHMALAGHNRYFKRAGDRFYRMEHFDVADMFGRRRHAVLNLTRYLEDGGSDREGRFVRMALSLENTGRAAAVAPYVYLKAVETHTRVEQRGLSQHTRSTDGLMRTVVVSRDGPGSIGLYGFVGLRDLVIPPGPAIDVGVAVVCFPPEGALVTRSVQCQFGAENAPLQKVIFTVDVVDLEKLNPAWLLGG